MKRSELPLIAVTAGEPAGIGPDLCVLMAREGIPFPMRFVVLGDKYVLSERAKRLNCQINIIDYDDHYLDLPVLKAGELCVLHIPVHERVVPGHLNPENSHHVLRMLKRAIQGCELGEFAAMVTCPTHKGIINEAGIRFTGHTEFLAEHTGAEHVVMMLVGHQLRVALATTHLALRDVANAITQETLLQVLNVLHRELQQKFRITHPRILVCGLNPHAGEGGHLGTEEIEIITPVLERLRRLGMHLIGPLPADTVFTPHWLEKGDCVLAMYHDQGLPVLKHTSFGNGINVTLGLPIIRTSVDHGTALELAGTGHIDCGSLFAAMSLAHQLAGGSIYAAAPTA